MVSPVTVTLEDVARMARVHRSTVALALRDHPRIALATRERVQQIAQKLGYRVNPLVAALMRSRRSGQPTRDAVIGYVTAHSTEYGWRPPHHDRPDFFPGARDRAKDFGYQLEHFWYAEPGMTPKRFRQALLARGIHGLIIGRMPQEVTEIELDWSLFSTVALGMTLQSPRLHRVTENHFDTVGIAMRQCRSLGYKRVGFVFSEVNDSPGVGDRWLGAYLAHRAEYFRNDPVPVCAGALADRESFLNWFRAHRPDALLVTHAAPVAGWIGSEGLRIPEDVGLVELQDSLEGSASGVCYDPAKIGALAVEMVVGLMYRNEKGVPSEPYEVLISGEWCPRRTLPDVSGRAARPAELVV
ncbi:MAG: LacI family DNA-binding transcriptional regulator [Nibricoccus sp.]